MAPILAPPAPPAAAAAAAPAVRERRSRAVRSLGAACPWPCCCAEAERAAAASSCRRCWCRSCCRSVPLMGMGEDVSRAAYVCVGWLVGWLVD